MHKFTRTDGKTRFNFDERIPTFLKALQHSTDEYACNEIRDRIGPHRKECADACGSRVTLQKYLISQNDSKCIDNKPDDHQSVAD